MTERELEEIMNAEYRPKWQQFAENVRLRIAIQIFIAGSMVYLLYLDRGFSMWAFCIGFGCCWFEPLRRKNGK